MPERDACATCGRETELEVDEHDGGSVECAPDGWGYIETSSMEAFDLYCPDCIEAARVKERALYFGDGA